MWVTGSSATLTLQLMVLTDGHPRGKVLVDCARTSHNFDDLDPHAMGDRTTGIRSSP